MSGLVSMISLSLLVGLGLVELVWIRLVRHNNYPWADVAASIGIKIGRRLVKLATAGLVAPVYFWAWDHRLWHVSLKTATGWALAFLMVEFAYYWQHRMHHEIRWMWAAHRTHHSTNWFNILTTSRTSVTGLISGDWLFYVPLAWLGIHPLAIFFLIAINLTYQIWLHTELVPKLGPLEWVLNTPSHHRVHHAVNPRYLDTNYGGVLIVFDRLFSTFASERADDPCRYGLVKPEHSYNPFVIVFREYVAIARDLWRAKSLREIAGYLFGPPGWSPDGTGATSRRIRATAAPSA
jgi:sterol desaturase/sphingolipid hydroxylase (fatty acid hydroxylase superfamily)